MGRFLSVAWTMTDYDGTTQYLPLPGPPLQWLTREGEDSMSEETHNAATLGPVAINTAVAASGVLGWLLTVTFCFCLGELEATLQSPTGMAVAQIFLNAAGTRGATLMWALVVLVQLFTGVSAMLACTRMAYAFARDGALPFSPYSPPPLPSPLPPLLSPLLSPPLPPSAPPSLRPPLPPPPPGC